jgi:4-hydroxybenzoate polyprenyltransferase
MAQGPGGVVTVPRLALRDYAELGRISNLPTCWTNVLVGCSIGAASGGEIGLFPTLAVMVAISCFYVAGMAMNDLFDVEIDQLERPGRPIPSGRISRKAANLFATTLIVLAVSILAAFGIPCLLLTLALLGVILLYNGFHKNYPKTFMLMGACRALVYLISAASIAWPVEKGIAGWFVWILFLYTVVITVVARSENEAKIGKRRFLATVMPYSVLSPILLVDSDTWVLPIILAFGFFLWNRRAVAAVWDHPPRTKEAVLTWLSGMCLVDAFLLSVLGRPIFSILALGAFALTALGHRRIMGT